MPLRKPPRPKWPDEATAQLDRYVSDYTDNVHHIAERLARQEHAEYVLGRHVDESFEAIARLGIRRVPFYKRAEFEIGVGSFFVGAALAFPDVLPVFFSGSWLRSSGMTIACVITCFLIGAMITMHGWYRAANGK